MLLAGEDCDSSAVVLVACVGDPTTRVDFASSLLATARHQGGTEGCQVGGKHPQRVVTAREPRTQACASLGR